jgi:threonine/homoserine/homoserine lactone efflux protein
MFDMINNLFLGIVGINMFIIGAVMVVEVIYMVVKKKRSITHIRSIINIVGGHLLVYFGMHLAGKYLLAF